MSSSARVQRAPFFARAVACARRHFCSPAGSLRRVALLLAALLVGAVPSVAAQIPSQLHVRWSSSSCPRDQAFDRELTRLLGDDASGVERSEIEVHIDTAEGSTSVVMQLRLDVAAGRSERTLALATCADARHAAALLIGTALEQARASAPSVSEPPEPQVPSAWHAQVGVLADLSTLPGLTGGPDVQLGWERAGLRLRVAGHYLVARETRDDDSALVAAIDHFAGSLGAAYVWPIGPLHIGPTVDAEVGALRARGRGEAGRPTDSARWAAALLGATAELPTHERLTLALSVQVGVPLSRPDFSLVDEDPFYTTAPATFRACLGARLRFGFKNEPGRGQ